MDPARVTPGVVCIGEAGALLGSVAEAGIHTRALNRTKRGLGMALAQLVVHMRRFRPDVVVVHGNNASVLGRLAAVLTRLPRSVVWIHQSADLDLVPTGPLQRCAEAVLRPFTAAYFGVALSQVPYLTERLGHPPTKIRIIQNGVDPDRFPYVPDPPRSTPLASSLGIRPNDSVVGIIAVMRPEKDHATFLRAARLVLDRVPHARFLIVGDGPRRDDIRRQAAEVGVAHRTIFTGMREDVSELLALTDVFTLSSTSECFPMSVLEAMATGRPTVCTAVGGVPEIVHDGVTGYLVPPSDPAALAQRLVELLRDPVQGQTMGKAARARVELEFNLDRSAAEAQRRLEEIVGHASGANRGGC